MWDNVDHCFTITLSDTHAILWSKWTLKWWHPREIIPLVNPITSNFYSIWFKRFYYLPVRLSTNNSWRYKKALILGINATWKKWIKFNITVTFSLKIRPLWVALKRKPEDCIFRWVSENVSLSLRSVFHASSDLLVQIDKSVSASEKVQKAYMYSFRISEMCIGSCSCGLPSWRMTIAIRLNERCPDMQDGLIARYFVFIYCDLFRLRSDSSMIKQY